MNFSKLNKEEFKKEFMVTPNSKLSAKYKVEESTIRVWGARLRLNKKIWLWSRHDENFILHHYGKGKYTIDELAKKIGRTRWSVINKYREGRGKRKKGRSLK